MDTKHSPTNVGLSFGGGGSQLSSSVSNLFWSQQFLFKQFHSVAGGAVIVKFIVFYMTCLSKSPGTRPGQSRLTKYFPRDLRMLSWRVTHFLARTSRTVALFGRSRPALGCKRFITRTPSIMSTDNGIGGPPADEKATLGWVNEFDQMSIRVWKYRRIVVVSDPMASPCLKKL